MGESGQCAGGREDEDREGGMRDAQCGVRGGHASVPNQRARMMICGLKPRLGAGASLRTRSRTEPALQGGDTREGFALLAVLWTLTAITMLTGAAMAVARVGSTTTRNRVLLTRAAWAREACGEILQARYAQDPSVRRLDSVDLGRNTWCTATLEDPSIKLNLNLADRAALVTVFHAVVRRSGAVDSLVDV